MTPAVSRVLRLAGFDPAKAEPTLVEIATKLYDRYRHAETAAAELNKVVGLPPRD